MAGTLGPWGRLKLVSKEPADESDHIYFSRSTHKIGRSSARADIVLEKPFISGLHCIVVLDYDEETKEPVVTFHDKSLNGIFLNEVLIGKGKTAVVTPNITVHFTKPGLQSRAIAPTVYKFEILPNGFTPENIKLRDEVSVGGAEATSEVGGTRSSASVPLTQPVQAKRRRVMFDTSESDLNATMNSENEARNKSDAEEAAKSDENDRLDATAQIHNDNQILRKRLEEAAEREVKLKETLHDSEQELMVLAEKLEYAEQRGNTLAAQLEVSTAKLETSIGQIEKLKTEVAALKKSLSQTQQDLETAQEKFDIQAAVLKEFDQEGKERTAERDAALAKINTLEEQLRTTASEKASLQVDFCKLQSKSQQEAENKRGAHQESVLLDTRLAGVRKYLRELSEQLTKCQRAAGEDIVSARAGKKGSHVNSAIEIDDDEDMMMGQEPETMDQEAALAAAAVNVIRSFEEEPKAADEDEATELQFASPSRKGDTSPPLSPNPTPTQPVSEDLSPVKEKQDRASQDRKNNISVHEETETQVEEDNKDAEEDDDEEEDEVVVIDGDKEQDDEENVAEENSEKDKNEGDEDEKSLKSSEAEEVEASEETITETKDAPTDKTEPKKSERWLMMSLDESIDSQREGGGHGIFDEETQLSED